MAQKPDKIVAEKIAIEFPKYGLIEEAEIAKFAHTLLDGQMSLEDWKQIAELSIARDRRTENAQTA